MKESNDIEREGKSGGRGRKGRRAELEVRKRERR